VVKTATATLHLGNACQFISQIVQISRKVIKIIQSALSPTTCSSSSNIVAIVVIVIIAAAATRLTEMPCNLKRLRDGHYFCDDKQSACIV